MKPRFTLIIVILIVIWALWVDIPNHLVSFNAFGKDINFNVGQKIDINLLGRHIQADFPIKLGLDLQGGTQLVLQTDMEKISEENKDTALESAREVIERRVNLFGVSESLVQSSKVGDQRRILVELPGLKDASAAAALVGHTAQLEFREMVSTPSAEATQSAMAIFDMFKPTGLTGGDLTKAQVTFGTGMNAASSPEVAIEFNGTGAEKFAQITKRNIGKPLGMFLDGVPVSWPPPTVNQEIIGGNAVITGQFSVDEAKNLAVQLNAGALPVPIKIIEQRSIGPTLGAESVNKSLIAGVIGLYTVILYMAFYYRVLGIIASLGLIIYAAIVLAIFKTGFFIFPPITLTLAGIAGFILSIGMAVDANILIFERMNEELRWGKSKARALELGFDRAWSSIWASNVSSLMTAAILYGMGSSMVRGFAVTLAIGVLVSMFTAIVVTRTFLRIFIR